MTCFNSTPSCSQTPYHGTGKAGKCPSQHASPFMYNQAKAKVGILFYTNHNLVIFLSAQTPHFSSYYRRLRLFLVYRANRIPPHGHSLQCRIPRRVNHRCQPCSNIHTHVVPFVAHHEAVVIGIVARVAQRARVVNNKRLVGRREICNPCGGTGRRNRVCQLW